MTKTFLAPKNISKILIGPAFILSLNVLAYSSGDGEGGGGGGDGGGEAELINRSQSGDRARNKPRVRQESGQGINNRNTQSISADISSIASQCQFLPQEYRLDCLAQELKESSRIVKNAGYKNANREIASAAKKLDRIVKRNEDKSAPKIKRNGKTYRAVKKSSVKKVNRQAKKVIAETKTKLIRSAGNSALKKTHYTKIAKAVGSTKVLLRSA